MSKAYSEPCQTSKMECFLHAKRSIVNVWQSSEYASVLASCGNIISSHCPYGFEVCSYDK